MNYYNPYMNFQPFSGATGGRTGLLSGLFRGGINWGSLFTNTQRTLGLVNQAIPVIRQVSPVVKNAKTMFRVMNEFKRVDTPVSTNNKKSENNSTQETASTASTDTVQSSVNNGPNFFV